MLEYVYDAILEEIFMSVWSVLSFEEEEGEVMRCRGDCLAALSFCLLSLFCFLFFCLLSLFCLLKRKRGR